MLKTLVWFMLTIAYIICGIYNINKTNYDYSDLPITIAGLIGLLSTLFLMLSQNTALLHFLNTKIPL